MFFFNKQVKICLIENPQEEKYKLLQDPAVFYFPGVLSGEQRAPYSRMALMAF